MSDYYEHGFRFRNGGNGSRVALRRRQRRMKFLYMHIQKENAKTLVIKEQILFEDPCGLTIEFCVTNSKSHPYRLRLYGDALKFGNREITFSKEGIKNGSGTAFNKCPFPFD